MQQVRERQTKQRQTTRGQSGRKMERRAERLRQNKAGMKASAVLLFRVATLAISNISLNVAFYYLGVQAHWSSAVQMLGAAAVGALTVLVAIVLFCPAAFKNAWQRRQ